jgi:uncharacterized integral membrane protein (TIGR00698 family)
MNRLTGIALTAALAAGATGLAQAGWLQANGISVVTLAIILGMVAGNTVYPRVESGSAAGVAFSKNTLLRVGIILYGLRLTLQDVATVGTTGIAIDAVVLTSTFALACWAGTRVFGLDRTTAMLIGAGSSICGAAAVMATEPVVRGRSEQVTVAVSTVLVFGTLAIFLYPVLYHANQRFGPFVSPTAYGIFAGSTIHEVAQVVAAGRAIGEAAADTAVITKMVRVMMLAPFLVILSMVLSRTSGTGAPRRIGVPWFALGFVAVTAFNSLNLLPRFFIDAAVRFDTLVLAMAMAALGLGTRWSAVRAAGAKPLALAALLFGWLLCGGAGINILMHWALAG